MPHRRLPAVFRVASSPLQAPRRFRNPENRPELGPSRPRDHESQFSFDSKLISLLPLDDVPVHVHRFAARVPCDSQGSECQCGIHTAEAASALRSRKTERAAKEKPTPISRIFFSTCSACTAKHLALESFQAVDLPFHLAVAAEKSFSRPTAKR